MMVKYRFILFVFVIALAILQLHRIEEQLELYFILKRSFDKSFFVCYKIS